MGVIKFYARLNVSDKEVKQDIKKLNCENLYRPFITPANSQTH